MSAILACVVYMSATLACVVRFFYLNSSWPQVTGVASTRNRFRMIMCVHSWRGSVESWFYKKLWSNNFRHMSLSLACVVQRWLFNEGDGSSTSSPAVTKVDGLPPASSFQRPTHRTRRPGRGRHAALLWSALRSAPCLAIRV